MMSEDIHVEPSEHALTIPTCHHFDQLETEAAPLGSACERCLAMGDTWVHLRSCLYCGLVGCCDDSKNKHARAHFEADGHPLVQSIEPGESWKYCFADHFLAR